MIVLLVVLTFAVGIGVSVWLESREKRAHQLRPDFALGATPVFAQDGGEPLEAEGGEAPRKEEV